MFYDVNDFPFLLKIKERVDDIREELNIAIKKDDVVRKLLDVDDELLDHYTNYWVLDNGFHTAQTGIDIRNGEYFAAAIYKKGFPIKHFDALDLFPKTLKLLNEVEGIEFAGFFKLCRNSKAKMHEHNRKHLVFHMMLNDLADGKYTVTCNGESKSYTEKGSTVIFDYSYIHGAENSSSLSDRLNLLIDFKPDFLNNG